MKFKEWQKEISLLGMDQKAEIYSGLKALNAWATFREEFGWTGIFMLGVMIQADMASEGVKHEKESSG